MNLTAQDKTELHATVMTRATTIGRAAEADRRLTWTDQGGWMIGDMTANTWLKLNSVNARHSTIRPGLLITPLTIDGKPVRTTSAAYAAYVSLALRLRITHRETWARERDLILATLADQRNMTIDAVRADLAPLVDAGARKAHAGR